MHLRHQTFLLYNIVITMSIYRIEDYNVYCDLGLNALSRHICCNLRVSGYTDDFVDMPVYHVYIMLSVPGKILTTASSRVH